MSLKRHKHADVIIAWANGEEIEIEADYGDWVPLTTSHPSWDEHNQYRIKPKIVKKEGWVNVYPVVSNDWAARVSYAYPTKSEADADADSGRVACIRIGWEEEQ